MRGTSGSGTCPGRGQLLHRLQERLVMQLRVYQPHPALLPNQILLQPAMAQQGLQESRLIRRKQVSLWPSLSCQLGYHQSQCRRPILHLAMHAWRSVTSQSQQLTGGLQPISHGGIEECESGTLWQGFTHLCTKQPSHSFAIASRTQCDCMVLVPNADGDPLSLSSGATHWS